MRKFAVLAATCVLGGTLALAGAPGASAGTQCLVVTEVYEAGGSQGATYNDGFVELLNRCNATVSLTGITLNLYSPGAPIIGIPASVTTIVLSGSIAAGDYYLVAMVAAGGAGAALPTPDASSSASLPFPGSVYLYSGTPPSPCPASGFIDLFGYGSDCFEGATEPPNTSARPTNSYQRSECTDTDNNATDFATGTPTPQNSASTPATVPCGGAVPPPTAVALRRFTAAATRSGILLRWRTASERGTLGFHVYRQVNGRRVRLNSRLMPGGRRSYSFLDRRAPRGKSLRYWLQEVALDGSRSWHGPARVRTT